jgi:hypothetical protein
VQSLDERYTKDPAVVGRQIAGGTILVPIRRKVGDLDSIYTLSETASCIWELVDGQSSLAQIRDKIVEEFEVGADEAQGDPALALDVPANLEVGNVHLPLVLKNGP